MAHNKDLQQLLTEKILILDGSTGVEIQRMGLSEADFRGDRFPFHPVNLRGNNDILALTAPERVASLAESYLKAGADIVSTNTFNAQRISQADYHTAHLCREINREAARLARREADRFTTLTPGKPRFVAGSVGPTSKTASMSASVADPASRSVSFDELVEAYTEQMEGLIEGGVDLLLIETIFDGLNAKAAAVAARRAIEARQREVPLVFSLTLSDASGRLLTGMKPEAFLASIAFAQPLAVGFNCSAGPEGLHPRLRELAAVSPFPTIVYPNAGLPDELGQYAETPSLMASQMAAMAGEGLINIAGGCCGTTPEHIRAIADALSTVKPRKLPTANSQPTPLPFLAGNEPLRGNEGFINVGERCNVAGSRKFLRLIKEGNYEEAVEIARKQVEDGAMMLDINMDDGLLDTPAEMEHFLRLLSAEPECARVPWMIDSSQWDVVSRALKCVQGKPVVNSISLKEGEAAFRSHARECRAMGAAVVVMAFDEQGQATTFERRIEICARAYRLLTEEVAFPASDIIFDPNILTVATGMAEHDRYALDYIRAVEWIKQNLPGARTSGGVSNLSFAFRGNNPLREAMHAVFLYHAIRAGLDMAIVNPATAVQYADIPASLRQALEDVILCQDSTAAERLLKMSAETGKNGDVKAEGPTSVQNQEALSVEERLATALRTGNASHLEADLMEAVEKCGSAEAVISGPLMNGMERIGQLFGEGKMFLPQVVKSARTMNQAVAILNPLLERGAEQQKKAAENTSVKGRKQPHFLLATVRGDVHDIGKNIAAVVLRCNGFQVTDLGVMVAPEKIVEATKRLQPDFIALSGLITPSLGEMTTVAAMLRQAGISAPLLVAGATTSPLHTALKIAPAYAPGLVVRVADASQNPVVASRLLSSDSEVYKQQLLASQQRLREEHEKKSKGRGAGVPNATIPTFPIPPVPLKETPLIARLLQHPETIEIPIPELVPLINWRQLLHVWRLKPEQKESEELLAEVHSLLDELTAEDATMRALVGFFPAHSEGETIVFEGRDVRIATPRCPNGTASSDFVSPKGDLVGAFFITTGPVLRRHLEEASDDPFRRLLLQSLLDRLAEAASEHTHRRVSGSDAPTGIRPAVGYPAIPSQAEMFSVARLLDPSLIDLKITETGALNPASSVAGLYILSPNARY